MEKWIPNYENLYSVTDDGTVYSNIGKRKKLKSATDKHGYKKVVLCNGITKKNKRVCRLVAETFIVNIFNKPEVNHINGIKGDDKIENLEWVTTQENNDHAIKLGLKNFINDGNPRARKVKCITTGKIFNTLLEGAKYYDLKSPHISDCCKGKRNHVGGYKWEYINV